MGKHSQFPWDLLKAECLRLVCSQLVQASNEGLSSYPGGGGRKEDMIEFLRDVETRTLDAAVETLQQKNPPRKHAGGAAEPPSPAKRARVEEEDASDEDAEGYNTRFKGVKRVKVREEARQSGSESKRSPRKSVTTTSDTPVKRGRGRPRKSVPEGTASAPAVSNEEEEIDKAEEGETSKAGTGEKETNKDAAQTDSPEGETKDEVVTPKRGRGRPRKSDSNPAAPKEKAAPKPKVTPKPKSQPAVNAEGQPKRGRGRPRKSVPTETAVAAPTSKGKEVFDGVHLQARKTEVKNDTADANGEDAEEDAVLAAVNGRGDVVGDGSSSLGGSNKENDPDEAFRYNTTNADHDVDMDADGDPDGEAEQTNAAPVAAA